MVVSREFAVPYLMELIDTRIRAIYEIDESLSGNNDQGSVLLWQSTDESRTVGERNGRQRSEGSQVVDFDKWIWEWNRLP